MKAKSFRKKRKGKKSFHPAKRKDVKGLKVNI